MSQELGYLLAILAELAIGVLCSFTEPRRGCTVEWTSVFHACRTELARRRGCSAAMKRAL